MSPKKRSDSAAASSNDNSLKKLKEAAAKIADTGIQGDSVPSASGADAPAAPASAADELALMKPMKDETDGAEELEQVSKQDRSHFIVAARRSKDPLLLDAYNTYMSLDRFDEKKSNIVALWKKDKSCAWWNSMKQEQGEADIIKKEDVAGFGTMRGSQYCW